jgi:hypothetical protein
MGEMTAIERRSASGIIFRPQRLDPEAAQPDESKAAAQ